MAESDSDPKIISRKEAMSRGLRHYFVRPCSRGHITPRLVLSRVCLGCARIRNRMWQHENKERVRRNGAEWRQKNKEKIRASSKEYGPKWRQKNKEKHRANVRRWRFNNQKRVRELDEKYKLTDRDTKLARRRELYRIAPEKHRQRSRDYRASNRQSVRERDKKWRQTPENKRLRAAIQRNREAKKRLAGGRHTLADIQDIFKAQKGKCAYCRNQLGDNYHVDHIIPTSKGGTNDRRNLQLLCPPCNVRKFNHDPIVHAQSLGLLL